MLERLAVAAADAEAIAAHVRGYVPAPASVADRVAGIVESIREGGDPIESALRRLGRVRIATKYPRIAGQHFAATGRQAEIVEVKGSVELAPLTGLVDGIVDLTATGTTLAENGLRVVEEIASCTARLIANPVSYRVKAAEIDAVVERLRAA